MVFRLCAVYRGLIEALITDHFIAISLHAYLRTSRFEGFFWKFARIIQSASAFTKLLVFFVVIRTFAPDCKNDNPRQTNGCVLKKIIVLDLRLKSEYQYQGFYNRDSTNGIVTRDSSVHIVTISDA